MIAGGEVGVAYPEAKFDWISPGDIGRVCGALLVGGSSAADGKNVLRLYGAEEMSQKDALGVIGKVLEKKLTLKELDESGGAEQFMASTGMPERAARHYVGILRGRAERSDGLFDEDAIGGIEEYSGRKPAGFGGWVAENKKDFEV
jgi:uncharacterized protein YbjT (DUF2867 family)